MREAVRQNDKNTPNGVENINSVKTSKTIKRVNIQNDLVVEDAIVEAMVGMGGQMLKFLVLLDSGADFSCARNNALLRLKEFGVNFVLKDPSGKGLGCVAANGTPMKVNGEINLDVDVNLESKRLVLENLKFVVMDNLSADFIIGVNVLRQTGFGIQGNSIWLGDATGRVSAIKKNYDILEKSGVWTGGDETWCLYEVHEPMKVMPTGVADSKLHIKPTSESTNISHITRESSSEMQAALLVCFQRGQSIPDKICRARDYDCTPTTNHCNGSISRVKRTEFISDESIRKMVDASSFEKQDKEKLREILTKHRQIFSTGDTDVGEYIGEKVKLNLERNDPVYVPVRRVPMALRPWLRERLKQMENSDIIEKSNGSSYNSPLFTVKKANGKWREVNDFRALNERLRDNHFPLPHLRDLLDELYGAKFFSSIDLRSGYFNVVLEEESRECTAFNVEGQTYVYKRLPQGIKVSPMHFQRIMVKTAGDLLRKSCLVFMDDLLAYDKTSGDALKTIDILLGRFADQGFLLNAEKCQFGVKEISYLGYTISSSGWVPQWSKVESITKFPIPQTVTQLRSFLGAINFFSASLPNLHITLKPLHELCGKKKGEKEILELTDQARKAFFKAKDDLVKVTEVAFYSDNPEDQLFLTTDASVNGWGCMLSQYQTALKREVPLGFGSGAFGKTEMNWPIHEKELKSFVSSMQMYQTYLFDRRFVWRTDNKALSHFNTDSVVRRTAKKISPKVSRWLSFINEFSFGIEHFDGTQPVMRMADALSRQDFGRISIIKDNAKCPWFEIWKTSGISEADLADAQNNDEDLIQLKGPYENLNRPEVKLSMKWGLRTCRFGKGNELIIIPESLVDQFLSYVHGLSHRGVNQMLMEIHGKYYIYSGKLRTSQFVERCLKCQRIKPAKRCKGKPIEQSYAKAPWTHVHMDLSGPFPKSWQGNRWILAVVCNLTRWCALIAIPSKHAESVAVGLKKVFKWMGPCTSLLADNGKEFANKDLRESLRLQGVHLQHSTPYRPQSNGIVERLNQKVKSLLKLHGATDVTWEDELDNIQLAINLEYNRSLGTSPYHAIFGWKLATLSFIKPDEQQREIETNEDSKAWVKAHGLRMARALADTVERDYNRKKSTFYKACADYQSDGYRGSPEIGVDSIVLVHFPQPVGECAKLYCSWKGYYRVLKVFEDNPNVCLLTHISGTKRQFMCHKEKLRVVSEPVKIKPSPEKSVKGINDSSLAQDGCGRAEAKDKWNYNTKELKNVIESPKNEEKRLRSGRKY